MQPWNPSVYASQGDGDQAIIEEQLKKRIVEIINQKIELSNSEEEYKWKLAEKSSIDEDLYRVEEKVLKMLLDSPQLMAYVIETVYKHEKLKFS